MPEEDAAVPEEDAAVPEEDAAIDDGEQLTVASLAMTEAPAPLADSVGTGSTSAEASKVELLASPAAGASPSQAAGASAAAKASAAVGASAVVAVDVISADDSDDEPSIKRPRRDSAMVSGRPTRRGSARTVSSGRVAGRPARSSAADSQGGATAEVEVLSDDGDGGAEVEGGGHGGGGDSHAIGGAADAAQGAAAAHPGESYEESLGACASLIGEMRMLVRDAPKLAEPRRTQQWLEDLCKLDQREMPKTVIGVLGGTGVGKSSLLNALLGEASILPTSGSRGCTAAVVELRYNEALKRPLAATAAAAAGKTSVYTGRVEVRPAIEPRRTRFANSPVANSGC